MSPLVVPTKFCLSSLSHMGKNMFSGLKQLRCSAYILFFSLFFLVFFMNYPLLSRSCINQRVKSLMLTLKGLLKPLSTLVLYSHDMSLWHLLLSLALFPFELLVSRYGEISYQCTKHEASFHKPKKGLLLTHFSLAVFLKFRGLRLLVLVEPQRLLVSLIFPSHQCNK